ncbi:MAG: TPR end-of-group domain-containing protein, partial [Candidatus Acidiferrales bacterium]
GFEVSAAILREAPQQLPAQVPAGLRSIIGRCLAKEPAQRYQRASELRAAVEAISSDSAAAPVGAVPAAGSPEAAPPRKPSTGSVPTLTIEQPRRSKWLVWGGAPLMLLLLGGLWYQQSLSQGANDAPSSAPAIPEAAYTGPRVSTGGKASPNAEANSYFEKATLFMRGQFDVPRARDLLEKALEADPKFAEARSMYALTHLLQVEGGLSNETGWLYRAEQQLQQALRDDPDCASAQAILGGLYVAQGKKELGGRQLEAAFQRDPRQLTARIWLVQYHRMSGDYPAGIAMARETLKIMPVFFISQVLLGNMLHEAGDMPAAVREYGGVLDQDAQNVFALRELARGHIETGDTKTAKIFLEKIRESDRRNYRVRLVWALLYAREGKRRDALKEMDVEVQKYAEVNPKVTLEAAEFYAILGDKAKALDWLEKAVRNGDERAEWFQRDPLLESIRGEDRFKNLLGSISYRRQRQKQKRNAGILAGV